MASLPLQSKLHPASGGAHEHERNRRSMPWPPKPISLPVRRAPGCRPLPAAPPPAARRRRATAGAPPPPPSPTSRGPIRRLRAARRAPAAGAPPPGPPARASGLRTQPKFSASHDRATYHRWRKCTAGALLPLPPVQLGRDLGSNIALWCQQVGRRQEGAGNSTLLRPLACRRQHRQPMHLPRNLDGRKRCVYGANRSGTLPCQTSFI